MAEVYKRTKNYEPISLAVVDEKTDEILAVLLAVVIREMSGFLGSFSARSIIQGGPLFVEEERGFNAIKTLMEHYDNIARKKALYTEIRNMWDTSQISSILRDKDYRDEDHFNFLIDLTKSKEELWNNLKRDKKRGVTKARKAGIEIYENMNKNQISVFYDILKKTYRDVKTPLADISLFESVFDILYQEKKAKFIFAKSGDKVIAGGVRLNYKKVIYAWYACALNAYLSIHPNELLVWHILEDGANKGYDTFDFLGAGKPNEEYGVREFKKQFGGQLVNFGRYKKIYSPFKMKIAEKGFKIYKKLCSR
jgi:serine/alanine adding enzyme